MASAELRDSEGTGEPGINRSRGSYIMYSARYVRLAECGLPLTSGDPWLEDCRGRLVEVARSAADSVKCGAQGYATSTIISPLSLLSRCFLKGCAHCNTSA
ncbi:hypothetical protein J6590_004046, partial [Homalodisca vitripennis]